MVDPSPLSTIRQPAAEQGAQPGSAAEAESGPIDGTLESLLHRMRHKSDFPAMSEAVVRILGMASSETESISSVTNAILKDVAVTNKLLRLVNSANFARAGGGISTVSRAVSLVGFNGIRNLALGLVLLEHMQDKVQADTLKEEFLRSLMAGSIAAELGTTTRESEEAFIGAMFQNLGRLLAEFYFPQEARTIRALAASARQPMTEAAACATVLGLNYETLGLGVAKVWGLPDGIRRCMHKPAGVPPARASNEAGERLRWLAVAANEISDLLLHGDPASADGQVGSLARRFAKTLGVRAEDIESATLVARKKLADMAAALELQVAAGSAAARLLATPAPGAGSAPDDALSALELHATQPAPVDAAPTGSAKAQDLAQTLSAGIQDITNAMVEDFKLNDVLRMILETMFRAMEFQRVVFCMRDPKTDALTGRFGLGAGVESVTREFRITLDTAQPDLFGAVCLKGADTMISDATDARIAARLPAWYLKSVQAPTFLLLPLSIKGRPFGLIYADKAVKGGLALDEKELSLLRTLRNQAVMAFKQST